MLSFHIKFVQADRQMDGQTIKHYAPASKMHFLQPGIEPRASGILSLHSTTVLLSHMSICLTMYDQIPVPDYIAIHLHQSVG